jgi:hypothetical protein
LELIEKEVDVQGFSADIFARDPRTDAKVLIENQVEAADHKHLGQILTYLAGLEAKTAIWIATDFHPARLSAIRWLNEHTSAEFSFFAVKLRVVQIGTSLMAPLFEVLERPNDWDRAVHEVAKASGDLSTIGQFRLAFWQHYLGRYPSEAVDYPADALSNRWRSLPAHGLIVSQYLAQRSVGVFIRGERGEDRTQNEARLAPHLTELERRLNASPNDDWAFGKSKAFDTKDRANWDQMADWLHETAELYVNTLTDVLGEKT